MKPGYLTLPTIWRGCTWPAVRLQWLDQDGHPINLNGWFPRAFTRHFDLNAAIIDAPNGVTRVSMNKFQTSELAQGVEDWDWVWLQKGASGVTLPPMIKGKVIVRHPVTNPEALTVVRIGGGSNYVTTRTPGPHYNLLGRYDLDSSMIREHLTTMRASGQNQIAIFCWYVSGLTWPDPGNPATPPNYFYPSRPWVYAHTLIPWHAVNPFIDPAAPITDATLSPQSARNLTDLFALLNELDFEVVNFRFGAQGNAHEPNAELVPPNDNWENAIPLSGLSGEVTGTTVGASRQSRARQWKFSTSTSMTDPGTGFLRINATLMSNASQMVVSNTTVGGFGQQDTFGALEVGDKIAWSGATVNSVITYRITALPVNHTGWWTLSIAKVTSSGGTPANNSLLNVTFVIDGKSNAAESEPDGGGGMTVWYSITGDNQWWSLQISRPRGSVIQAFHGAGVYHLIPDGTSNGSLSPPQPCIFFAQTGTTYYIRVGQSNVRMPDGPPQYPDYFTLAYKRNAGANEPPVPEYPTHTFPPEGWNDTKERQAIENSSFLKNVTTLVEAVKGSMRVTYDLMPEGSNARLYYSHIHRYYLARIWREWSTRFGVFNSCCASSLPQGYGIAYLIDLLNASLLTLPGFYAVDTYGAEIDGLTRIFNILKAAGGGESSKRICIFETYYNDPQVAKDLRQVIRATGLNFGGVTQWPRVKGTTGSFPFPDGYPRQFNQYINL